TLHGLQDGVLPIELSVKSFRIVVPIIHDSVQTTLEKTVSRRQYPITAAYTFTDYRLQGQTILYVVVNIASPPSGSDLTLFNIYVALSRSSGRDTIRLLRDFDERIFQKPIDPYLAREDERLRNLD
ncbi:hypothetical protein B0H21DRAFT_660592, partial [Amylocystis lapponica]